MKAALVAQLNKTDRHDARGIAHMMRVGLFKPVHVKTPSSQRLRTVLTARQLLRNKLQDRLGEDCLLPGGRQATKGAEVYVPKDAVGRIAEQSMQIGR